MQIIEEKDIRSLTLNNYIYTKDGKFKISSIEEREGPFSIKSVIEETYFKYFINGIPISEILFFDNSWIGIEEFEHFGFELKDDNLCKGDIILKFVTFDGWHVCSRDDDFGELFHTGAVGERFYTAAGLEEIVHRKFNIELKIVK